MQLKLKTKKGEINIPLTDKKEECGTHRLVVIKNNKKYYAPLVEKEKLEVKTSPRIYVIGKDKIKRYITTPQTVPSGVVYSKKAILSHLSGDMLHGIAYVDGRFIVPKGITMLNLEVDGYPESCYLKVIPKQKIYINVSCYFDANSFKVYERALAVSNMQGWSKTNLSVFGEENERLKIEYSKEINEYKGSDIIDVTKYGDWEDYDKSDIPEFKEMKGE